MDDPRSDEGLMLAYRDGDATAFESLYVRYRGRLYRYLAHQAPRHADELFQDIWFRVIAARSGYGVSAKFSTWLFRIAHNRLIDHFRARSRSRAREYGQEDDPEETLERVAGPASMQPLDQLERKRAAQRIAAALAELPGPQQEAFLLAEEGGLSVDEIAQATGVGKETAKSRLRYAVARLRRSLEDLR